MYGKTAAMFRKIVRRVLTDGKTAGIAYPNGDVQKMIPLNRREDTGEEKTWLPK